LIIRIIRISVFNATIQYVTKIIRLSSYKFSRNIKRLIIILYGLWCIKACDKWIRSQRYLLFDRAIKIQTTNSNTQWNYQKFKKKYFQKYYLIFFLIKNNKLVFLDNNGKFGNSFNDNITITLWILNTITSLLRLIFC
jgi:hypothetical protein